MLQLAAIVVAVLKLFAISGLWNIWIFYGCVFADQSTGNIG